MHPILQYLFKMLLCSGILYGYYRVVLYNERFHQWNRFYLLAAMVLSIVVPLLEIPLMAEKQSAGIIYLIETMPATIVAKATPLFSTEDVVYLSAGLVSVFIFLKLMWGLYKTVYSPYQQGDVSAHEDISVIITETPAAPYSFFRWLFWRSDLSPETTHGKRILEHELTHIREKHSADKLFTELLLVAFWCNPFFWMIRKELYVIHEFLADRKAITDNNGAAFAHMILQTMNVHTPSPLTNPFFSSQIKRRLKMITTSNKPQFSYLRRITALLAMTGVSLTLMLTIEKGMAQKAPPPPPPPPPTAPAPPPPPATISLPDSIKSIEVNQMDGKNMVTVTLTNGKVRKMNMEDAVKKGYPVTPPTPPIPALPPAPPQPPVPSTGPAEHPILNFSAAEGKDGPIFIYAGLQITGEQVKQIDPKNIESIEILKGENAIAAYGEKGINGVVKIMPRNQEFSQITNIRISANGEIDRNNSGQKGKSGSAISFSARPVQGYELNTSGKTEPLFVLNGKIITSEEVKSIDPNSIERINVLKDKKAIETYGPKGANGVVEIILKNNHEPAQVP